MISILIYVITWDKQHYLLHVHGNAQMISYLLSHQSINLNIANNLGFTPLFIACINNHELAIKVLLSHPLIDINKCNKNGISPLEYVKSKNKTNIVKLLMEKEACM